MSSRCCAMWAVSRFPSSDATGEAAATHTQISPRRKLAARHAGMPRKKVERSRRHPRKYAAAVRARISAITSGGIVRTTGDRWRAPE